MFYKFNCTFLLILTHFYTMAGGSMVIGGANQLRYEQGSAWFLGDQAVRVCAEFDDKFPFEKEATLKIFGEAFNQWVNYIVDRRVEDWSRGDRPDGAKFISKKLLFQKSCAKDTDLRLIFGHDKRKEIINDSKTLFRPISFVIRKSFNLHKGRGKGYLWLSSENKFWKEADRPEDGLYGIILHELGHIFGVPHISGTIMSESYISNIIEHNRSEFYFDQARKIDHYRTIIGSPIDHGLMDTNRKRVRETFKFITGREVNGEAYCRFSSNDSRTKVFFYLWDSLGEEKFEANAAWNNYDAGFLDFNAPTAFKTYHNPEGARDNDWKFFNDRRVAPTANEFVFTDKMGKEFKVMSINNAQIREALGDLDNENQDPKYATFPSQFFVLKDREFSRICGPSYYFVRIQHYW